MTEYVSGAELREKIIAVICEQWPEPGRYLESATIYERLISEGVEVPDHAISEVLLELAKDDRIKLAVEAVPPRLRGPQARWHDHPRRKLRAVPVARPQRLFTEVRGIAILGSRMMFGISGMAVCG
jgi:hypothetical protein